MKDCIFISVGVIILLVIYYTLGIIPTFCAVGGLMIGQLFEKLGWW